MKEPRPARQQLEHTLVRTYHHMVPPTQSRSLSVVKQMAPSRCLYAELSAPAGSYLVA